MRIFYINTHDTGTFTSPYGYHVPTPALMEFGKDATIFRNAHTASPTCSPSRGALLTGRYPHENGLVGLAHRGFSLTDKTQHLAHFLQAHNYHTVLAGLQHENAIWAFKKSAKKLGYKESLISIPTGLDGDSYAKWDANNADKLVNWIHKNHDKENVFVSYGTFATHRKYPETTFDSRYVQLPPTLHDSPENRDDTARLYQTIQNFDDNFAKIIHALKEHNIYEDSLIIVTTDHGLANPFAKCTLTKDGTQVQLIMRHPDYFKPGSIEDTLTSQLDIFPTICDIIGLDKPANLRGYSMVKERTADRIKPDETTTSECTRETYHEINYHTSFEPQRAIRTKRYLYIQYLDDEWQKYNISNCDSSPQKTLLLEHEWEHKKKKRELFFDLFYDPQERVNQIDNDEYHDIINVMREKMRTWREETNDRLDFIEAYAKDCKVNDKADLSN